MARQSAPHLMKIEVEVTNRAQLNEAIAARADVIMLDNMTIEEIRSSVALIREQAPGVLIEVSGGITLETVRGFAEAGVDLISVGALTHSATAVDISLKIAPL
jgi:nicotinate-nucleotide pyrophosphorylase (carboxylating)